MTRNKLFFLAMSILLLICTGSSIAAMIYAKNEEAYITGNLLEKEVDQETVAIGFFTRMRLHDEGVFNMIDPALELNVERWFQTHAPMHCVPLTGSTYISPRNNGRWHVEHICDIARNNEFWNYTLFLFDITLRRDDYYLEIYNIEVVQNQNGEWKVVGFSEPREKIGR